MHIAGLTNEMLDAGVSGVIRVAGFTGDMRVRDMRDAGVTADVRVAEVTGDSSSRGTRICSS